MGLESFSVASAVREELVEITESVADIVSKSKLDSGVVVVFVPHTTCGVTINENADAAVKTDFSGFLAKLIPKNASFRHTEGNSDAHIKSSLVGSSVTIPIENGSLVLGTWQGIFLAEFDGPRNRTVLVSVR